MVIFAVGRTLLRGGRLRVAKAEGARAGLLLDPLPNARLAQRPDRRGLYGQKTIGEINGLRRGNSAQTAAGSLEITFRSAGHPTRSKRLHGAPRNILGGGGWRWPGSLHVDAGHKQKSFTLRLAQRLPCFRSKAVRYDPRPRQCRCDGRLTHCRALRPGNIRRQHCAIAHRAGCLPARRIRRHRATNI